MTYEEIAAAATPAGIEVKYRKSLSGWSNGKSGKLVAPKPTTRKSLYIYLHECAHLHLRHSFSSKHSYIKEYEAEVWAHEMMRKHGIAVPETMTTRAKCYVAYRLKRGLRRGLKDVDRRVLAWIGNHAPRELAA